MLEVRNITKIYHPGTVTEQRLFENFSLTVEQGQFVSIVGSNGSGKTSLLNIICGSIPIEGGEVLVGGKPITKMKDYRRYATMGRVYQNPAAGTCPNLTMLENLSLAEGERDLQEIRQELVETGYLRRGKTAAKRQKRVSGKPMEFRSSAGLRISVGKNNSQNDQLTTKLAYKSDIWLHTQKIHGSHVILWLEGGEADAQSLTEAAILAATFSQAGEGSRVPVDYTPVKYVKKPAGARPGMVVYTTYQTAVVDPDPELAKRLRVK